MSKLDRALDLIMAVVLLVFGLYFIVGFVRGVGDVSTLLAGLSAVVGATLLPFKQGIKPTALKDAPRALVLLAVFYLCLNVGTLLARVSSPENEILELVSWILWSIAIVLLAMAAVKQVITTGNGNGKQP
jgi:hypothetical protein